MAGLLEWAGATGRGLGEYRTEERKRDFYDERTAGMERKRMREDEEYSRLKTTRAADKQALHLMLKALSEDDASSALSRAANRMPADVSPEILSGITKLKTEIQRLDQGDLKLQQGRDQIDATRGKTTADLRGRGLKMGPDGTPVPVGWGEMSQREQYLTMGDYYKSQGSFLQAQASNKLRDYYSAKASNEMAMTPQESNEFVSGIMTEYLMMMGEVNPLSGEKEVPPEAWGPFFQWYLPTRMGMAVHMGATKIQSLDGSAASQAIGNSMGQGMPGQGQSTGQPGGAGATGAGAKPQQARPAPKPAPKPTEPAGGQQGAAPPQGGHVTFPEYLDHMATIMTQRMGGNFDVHRRALANNIHTKRAYDKMYPPGGESPPKEKGPRGVVEIGTPAMVTDTARADAQSLEALPGKVSGALAGSGATFTTDAIRKATEARQLYNLTEEEGKELLRLILDFPDKDIGTLVRVVLSKTEES